MYINNANLSKAPKWLYAVVPILFFGFVWLNYIALQTMDTEAVMAEQIAEMGELPFLVMNLLPFAVLLGLLLLWVKFVHRQSLTTLTTARSRISWWRFFFAFFLWGGISTALIAADYLINPQDYQWNFQLVPFLKLLAIAIVLVPLQTAFEEYFFRAYLMQGLALVFKRAWVPLVITSVLFGLMHIANPEMEKLGYGLLIYYIGTGFFLGITAIMDDGIELSLGFHAANNLFTALWVTSTWTVFQTPSVLRDVSEPTLGWNMFLPLLVCFPLLLWIYAKKYKWKDWRVRLVG